MEEKPDKKERNLAEKSLYILLIVLLIVSISNIFTLNITMHGIDIELADTEEAERPPDITITSITYSSCPDCFDLTSYIEQVKRSGANIVSERSLDYSSQEARGIIDKYNIEKVPVFIVEGETDKTTKLLNVLKDMGRIDGGVMIFTKQTPVYLDLATGELKGRVSAVIIEDSSCSECIEMDDILDTLESLGASIYESKTLEYSSPEARELISEHGITTVPALLVSDDIMEYEEISGVWDQLNSTLKNGFYAVHAIQPPYRNLASGEIEGLITMIILSDESCGECYDISTHKLIISNFGGVISNEIQYDIASAEGQELIEEYNITKAPTIMLSPEVDAYPSLSQVFSQVSSLEDDGWYVFRSVEQMGTYKDLETGSIVSIPQL